MTRITAMMMGEATGELETIRAGDTTFLNSGLPKNISDESIEEAIEFSRSMDSHALLIYHNDEIILEKYFNDYNAETISDTQSMHKTVLAMMIGIAIDEGIIESVNESASKYLTEWKDDSRKLITIKHLLQQSSGLDYPEFSFHPLSEFNQLMLGEDVTKMTLLQTAYRKPNELFEYNGSILRTWVYCCNEHMARDMPIFYLKNYGRRLHKMTHQWFWTQRKIKCQGHIAVSMQLQEIG